MHTNCIHKRIHDLYAYYMLNPCNCILYMLNICTRFPDVREMTDGDFEKLMVGIRAIVAERLQASLLWDDLLNDFTFPVSQELNTDAEVMSPECELDLNS